MIVGNMIKNIAVSSEKGFVSASVVVSIVLGVLALVFGSIMIWALVSYNEQKNNVDQKILAAQEVAKSEQKAKDQEAFEEKEKNPLTEFIGPNDLGRVNFKYPKTWNVYVASDGSNNTGYQAYLHPDVVPPATGNNKFALQVSIVSQAYDQVLQQYSGQVKQGSLRSSTITANGFNGQRFDGKLSQNIDGSAVVFKIRDKTLMIKTDSTAFRPDFDDKIIKTLSFDQ